MQVTLNTLAALRRPRLLISAARFGIARYDREAFLERLFGIEIPAPGKSCLVSLLAFEAEIEKTRKSNAGTYCIAAHIEMLAAIMAESQILRNGTEIHPPRRSPRGEVVDLGARVRAMS